MFLTSHCLMKQHMQKMLRKCRERFHVFPWRTTANAAVIHALGACQQRGGAGILPTRRCSMQIVVHHRTAWQMRYIGTAASTLIGSI